MQRRIVLVRRTTIGPRIKRRLCIEHIVDCQMCHELLGDLVAPGHIRRFERSRLAPARWYRRHTYVVAAELDPGIGLQIIGAGVWQPELSDVGRIEIAVSANVVLDSRE